MGYNSISISHLSLQYVEVPVKATLTTGVAYDPTSNPVSMAFIAQATAVPQLSDWQTASWAVRNSDILYPYVAVCLIGPGSTVQLGIGTYVIYVRVQGNPEIPILQASLQLEVY
jgi:hypothetical protein